MAMHMHIQRNRRIVFLVTPDEQRALKRYAGRKDVLRSVGDVIRTALQQVKVLRAPKGPRGARLP
jgi:hypothetical protein